MTALTRLWRVLIWGLALLFAAAVYFRVTEDGGDAAMQDPAAETEVEAAPDAADVEILEVPDEEPEASSAEEETTEADPATEEDEESQ